MASLKWYGTPPAMELQEAFVNSPQGIGPRKELWVLNRRLRGIPVSMCKVFFPVKQSWSFNNRFMFANFLFDLQKKSFRRTNMNHSVSLQGVSSPQNVSSKSTTILLLMENHTHFIRLLMQFCQTKLHCWIQKEMAFRVLTFQSGFHIVQYLLFCWGLVSHDNKGCVNIGCISQKGGWLF